MTHQYHAGLSVFTPAGSRLPIKYRFGNDAYYGLQVAPQKYVIYKEADLAPDGWTVSYRTENSRNPYRIVINSDGSDVIFHSKLDAYRFARALIGYHDNVRHIWAQARIRPYVGTAGEMLLTTKCPPVAWRIGDWLYTPLGQIKRCVINVQTLVRDDVYQDIYTFNIGTYTHMPKHWKMQDLAPLNPLNAHN